MATATSTPAQQLDRFVAKFSPDVARTTKSVLRAMRKRLPGALELVYDNYNALAIGFSPTERVSDVIFSIAVFPRWVSLFFYQSGAKLPDPKKRLAGNGKQVRHVVLENGAKTLDDPYFAALMREALRRARTPLDPKQRRRIVIKSIAKKQRPRRPD